MNKNTILSSHQLLDIFSASPIATAIYTSNDLIIEAATDAMIKIWGKCRKDVIGFPILEAVPQFEGQPFICILKQVLKTGIPETGFAIPAQLNLNGVLETRYFDFEYSALKNENNEIYCVLHIASDVTERVLGIKALESTVKSLQSIITTFPIAMTILRGRDFIVEEANIPMFNIWQKEPDDVLGRKIVDIFPELLDQAFPLMLADVYDNGKRIALSEIEVSIKRDTGDLDKIFVDFSYDPLFDDDGKVEAILVTVSDITEIVITRKALEKIEFDLKNTSEELAVTNEELATINEEMTVSNEELIHANEYLIEIQDELKNSLLQLKESEERFRFLLNAIPQQVWTAKPDGKLDYVNDVISEDFGYINNDIIGDGWQKFIHPDDINNAFKKWEYALKTGEEYMVEFRLLFADNTYKWHLARAIPYKKNNEISLWLGTSTNIDLQKNNEQRKDEFLSIASHELKTPLTSIKAFNQLMKRTDDIHKLLGFVNKSSEHIQRLERLIGDLLDVTKLNSGKMDYNADSFNFKQLIKDSCENAQNISITHQIIVESNVDFDFKGDYFRLEQVMNNFLTNAIKYSPDGKKIIVNSKLEENYITVSVKDFGIGIAQSHLNKLFDRYYRVDNTAMRFEGLGLGLFISSEILKRHQGTFWIESELGKGSTFCFKLPILNDEVSE